MNTDFFLQLVTEVGLTKAVFSLVILSCHFYIFSLYNDRLRERQAEIDRLAEENHQYRDRFLKLIDNTLSNKKEGK